MGQLYIFGMEFSTFVRSVKLYCEEKGIVYQSGMSFDGQTVTLHDSIHYKLHPFGKVPIILHNGNVIVETTTICRYLDLYFTEYSLVPKKIKVRTEVDQWSTLLSYYFDSILVRQYLLEFTFPKGNNGTIRYEQIEKVEPQVLLSLQQLEQQLGNKSFFVHHHYTMADAILTPMLDYLAKLPHAERLFKLSPNLLIYLDNMQARPSGKTVFLTSGA